MISKNIIIKCQRRNQFNLYKESKMKYKLLNLVVYRATDHFGFSFKGKFEDKRGVLKYFATEFPDKGGMKDFVLRLRSLADRLEKEIM